MSVGTRKGIPGARNVDHVAYAVPDLDDAADHRPPFWAERHLDKPVTALLLGFEHVVE